MTAFTNAVASPAGDGQMAMAFGPHLIRIRAEDTGGALGVLEATVPAGEGPPPHVHAHEEEMILVQAGRFTFQCGAESVTLEPGGCIVLPRGVPHGFRNTGDTTGRLLVVVTPGGFEGFFPEIERRQPAGPEAIGAIAADFGVRFLAPDEANAAA